MILETSREKTYTAVWADVASSGVMYAQIVDPRPLAEIAAEMDGLKWLMRRDENQGDKEFKGYNHLTEVTRITAEVVKIAIKKGDEQ